MKLYLAPMEGVGDRAFRKAMATIGGFDEAVTDFIRVSANPQISVLANNYDPQETTPIPLAAQIMGSDPENMALMCQALEKRGAPRIDLNCGCPSNTVTGRGAGSSLLKEPDHLYEVAKAMVKAVSIPVTLKMRSGFQDTSLFRENLLAAQESGVQFLTLHPRTKIEGYGPPANWDLIREAKSILSIPVVGNGDILKVDDALRMVKETGCDALMIGRGAIINPFIFQEIKAELQGASYSAGWTMLSTYFETYLQGQVMSAAKKVCKLKQVCGFLFKSTPMLLEKRTEMLRGSYETPEAFLNYAIPLIKEHFYFPLPPVSPNR